jgi:hypothetical protein
MKCSKGKMFLKDLNVGDMFNQNGTEGILLGCEINAEVLVLTLPNRSHFKNNESYYKGKHIWSAHTEVKKV